MIIISPHISKRSGLDKAVHQLGKAIKCSKNNNVPEEEGRRLQLLLSEAENLVSGRNDNTQVIGHAGPRNNLSSVSPGISDQALFSTPGSTGQMETEDVSLDDAENPLQLLARASDLADTAAKQRYMPSSLVETGQLRRFFGPFQPRLDVGYDIDPIDIGLVTHEEVTMLIK